MSEILNDTYNDIIFTPDYIADFMCELTKVDTSSIVVDNTCGGGNLLMAAIRKGAKKVNGVEFNKIVYDYCIEQMGEVLDLCNIVQGDGMTADIDYSSCNVLLSNPPYSKEGKGLIFIKKAFDAMGKGFGAVLIQENAGSGAGLPYAKDILKNNTLMAAIHLSEKVFAKKASVQTAIYLFEIGKPHDVNNDVIFIDFRDDGYRRSNRKNSNKNLVDVDNVKERYEEVINIIHNKDYKPTYYTEENGLLILDKITLEGNDWTHAIHRVIDTTPVLDDFKKTVRNYMLYRNKPKAPQD